jgi:hypothetical protein
MPQQYSELYVYMAGEGPEHAGKKFIDKTGEEEGKKGASGTGARKWCESARRCPCGAPKIRKQIKGVWGMPWLPEMTKDAVSCEKLRGGANDP